ncbi:MAG: hypothetical protein SCH98_08715 [Deferrisomatales bacterium]|nr:hypothetical protein [Deferrisomatales bacterium]
MRHPDAFDPRELRLLAEAVPLAQELTGERFALADDWFRRTAHRILSRRDLRDAELLTDGRLAEIRRVFRVEPEGAGRLLRCERLCPHYRICLQDHNILHLARRREDVELSDVLVSVLTHEYVHLVRFCRLEHPYHAPEEHRSAEEARVGELSREILRRSGHPGLRRAAETLSP